MESAIIKFLNGTEIITEINGNCFITEEKPDFPENMSEVTVEKENEVIKLFNARVQDCAPIDNRYWFILLEATPSEILESQVFYTAMMTDTLLEE